jgi:hypothetical protein
MDVASPFRTMLFFLALAAPAFAGDLVFDSTTHRVNLLELYTSEGCSSCPPAEAWFSKLKENPGLWKDFVPIAFHVDYWDGLGWPDRFASQAFTARQRDFASSWGSGTVYTPGFVLNGTEWQGRGEIPVSAQGSGLLKATLAGGRDLAIRYTPASGAKRWEAHVATLGFNLESDVRAGENSGHILRHDFVVLSLTSQPLRGAGNETTFTLPAPVKGERAVAMWVTEAGGLTPIQAAGGWLN